MAINMPIRILYALFAMLAFAACASGPTGAASKIVDAVQAGDANALDRHVDWPQLRANLKADLNAELSRRTSLSNAPGAKAEDGSAFAGALLGALAAPVISEMVDALATPEGVIEAIETGRLVGSLRLEGLKPAGSNAVGAPFKKIRTKVLRRGMTGQGYEILFGADGANEAQAFKATLAMRDGRWKLVRLEPPKTR